jgi:hypothetical protein
MGDADKIYLFLLTVILQKYKLADAIIEKGFHCNSQEQTRRMQTGGRHPQDLVATVIKLRETTAAP